ncbi:MAG: hypothetical protein HQK83_00945 [Fibrobacteria bacterium]|nr:hypothetical protein [Fibrobacteria bacterium]
MNTFLYQIVLVAFVSTSFGAQYFPLVKKNAKWIESSCSAMGGIETYQFQMKNDTIVSAVNYQILEKRTIAKCLKPLTTFACDDFRNWDSTSAIKTEGFIREDTATKTVYFRGLTSNTEEVLYNFNVDIQDTVLIDYRSIPMVVTKIDSILIKGMYRNEYSLTGITTQPLTPVSLIEGIGTTCGLFGVCDYFEGGTSLLCYKQDNEVLHGECQDVASNLRPNTLEGLRVQQENSSLTVYISDSQDKQISLKVSAIDGIVLYNKRTIDSPAWTIHFSEFRPVYRGVFVLSIESDSKIMTRVFQVF